MPFRLEHSAFLSMLFPLRQRLLAYENVAALKRQVESQGGILTTTPADLALLLERYYEGDADVQAQEMVVRGDDLAVARLVEGINARIVNQLVADNKQHKDLRADEHFRYELATYMNGANGYMYGLGGADKSKHMFDDPCNQYTNVAAGNGAMGLSMERFYDRDGGN